MGKTLSEQTRFSGKAELSYETALQQDADAWTEGEKTEIDRTRRQNMFNKENEREISSDLAIERVRFESRCREIERETVRCRERESESESDRDVDTESKSQKAHTTRFCKKNTGVKRPSDRKIESPMSSSASKDM